MFSDKVSQIREKMTAFSSPSNSEQNRSRDRYLRAALTGGASAASKVVSFATSILTVRWTLHYLGAERYGMWITITSVVMLLMFSDLGMGNGLIKAVADSMGRNDVQEARKAITSAFVMLTGVALLLALLAVAIYPFVDTSRLFNVHSALAVRESGPAIFAFLLYYVFSLPLGVVFAVENGLQRGYVWSLWSSVGTIASLGALVIAMRLHAGLPVLVLCLFGPSLLATIVNGVFLFGFTHPQLRPVFRAFSTKTTSHLFNVGFMFFLIQISLAVGMQTDNIVIAQILGASAVAAYAVPARMFNMILGMLVLVSGSMWPAYADALSRSDSAWIRKSFLRVAVFGGVITALATLFLVVFGNRILMLWVGPQIQASRPLLMVFALQSILYAYLQPITFLLNGLGKLRIQVICSLAMAVVNLGLSILFVKLYGIIGVVMGTSLALLAVEVVPLTFAVRSVLRQLDHAVQKEDLINAELQFERSDAIL